MCWLALCGLANAAVCVAAFTVEKFNLRLFGQPLTTPAQKMEVDCLVFRNLGGGFCVHVVAIPLALPAIHIVEDSSLLVRCHWSNYGECSDCHNLHWSRGICLHGDLGLSQQVVG